jgi:hypothetical protein
VQFCILAKYLSASEKVCIKNIRSPVVEIKIKRKYNRVQIPGVCPFSFLHKFEDPEC